MRQPFEAPREKKSRYSPKYRCALGEIKEFASALCRYKKSSDPNYPYPFFFFSFFSELLM
jgi:hypothetical protein